MRMDAEIRMNNPAAPPTSSDTSARRFYHGTRAEQISACLVGGIVELDSIRVESP